MIDKAGLLSPRQSDPLIEDAKSLSSATLHEAGGRIGALPSSLRPIAPGLKLCGRAFPIACPPGDNLHLHHAIYAAAPGDILVVDTAGGTEFGYWGEIMAVAAQARGLAGLVITGGVRDSARMIELGFPVFSQTICVRGTDKDPHGPGALGARIVIGGIPIEAGDLVFGDDDGVVVIPRHQAAEIVEKSRQRDQKEAEILARLRSGDSTVSIYGLPDLADARQRLSGHRHSVEVPGLSHGHLPIPVASRIGPFIATGGIRGVDPATGKLPPDIDAQARLMFVNLRAVMDASGACCEDIIKMTIWLSAPEGRGAVNAPWTEMFPDPLQRPARHILIAPLPGDMLVQCEALAVAQSGGPAMRKQS